MFKSHLILLLLEFKGDRSLVVMKITPAIRKQKFQRQKTRNLRIFSSDSLRDLIGSVLLEILIIRQFKNRKKKKKKKKSKTSMKIIFFLEAVNFDSSLTKLIKIGWKMKVQFVQQI